MLEVMVVVRLLQCLLYPVAEHADVLMCMLAAETQALLEQLELLLPIGFVEPLFHDGVR